VTPQFGTSLTVVNYVPRVVNDAPNILIIQATGVNVIEPLRGCIKIS